jgi:hypothetical protein
MGMIMNMIKDHDMNNLKSKIKNRLIGIFAFCFLSSISIIPILFIPDSISGFSWLALLSLLGLTLFGLSGILLNLSINSVRKEYKQRGVYNQKKSPAFQFFFPFFSNMYATIFDVLLILCLLFSGIIIKYNLQDNILAIYGVLFILSLEMHAVLNGKNFDFYYNFIKVQNT